MKKVIYTRFSNERSRAFSIRTAILEDENGQRFVRKSACWTEGEKHLARMVPLQDTLDELYRPCGLCCNRCHEEDGAVWFEYLTAETLEECLDRLLAEGKTEEARAKLIDYLDRVQKIVSREPFTVTPAFTKVFGSFTETGSFLSAPVTNIDMVCQNVMLTETPTLLDHEWSFPFPVPAPYVLFRILHYYLETLDSRRKLGDGLYERYGITEPLKKQFLRMERCFQRYMRGGVTPLGELYRDLGAGTAVVQALPPGSLQVYFSYGTGYREEDSARIPIKDREVRGSVGIPEGCTAVRVDPGDEPCTVKIRQLSFDDKKADLSHAKIPAGVRMGNDIRIRKADPGIFDIPVPSGAKRLRVHMEILPKSEGSILPFHRKERKSE
ncbi:MAG: hypothetical protein IJX90_02970 [Blautia sp.]|nr:hypothetical protein [Blautia sp.]